MKKNRFRLLTVLLAAVMLVALSFNVYASQSSALTQDGLTAQVLTDKDSYKTGESVNVTVRVDNHTGKDVWTRTYITVPSDVTLASEKGVYDAVLQDGQVFTTSGGVSSAETAGSVPATGDHAHVGFWIILTIVAVCSMIALYVFGKNKKTWLSMLLCLTMVGGLVAASLPVQAADISGSMEVSCMIQVDGKDSEVTATVNYVIYDVNDEAEEAESIETSEAGDSGERTEPGEPSEPSGETDESGEVSEESSESTEESGESGEESSESTEESGEFGEESSESTEESGESGEESSESTEEGDESGEESSESGENDNESSEEEDGVIYELTFDDLDTFVNTVDFVRGGGYSGGVTLTTEVDHTTGNGQSLKMEGRKSVSHRVKLLNVLEDIEVGESYVITAWVYSDTAVDNVGIGAYSAQGTQYASTAIASSKCDIEAGTWTKIELEYKHTDESITQLGVGQISGTKLPETIYLDDIMIVRVEGAEEKPLVPVTLRDGKRPTPNVTNTGNTYDDLIFYDRTFEENPLTSEDMFNKLPDNPVIMADNDDMLAAPLAGPKYGKIEVVDVDAAEELPFSQAIRATVESVPTNPYLIQLELKSLDAEQFAEGDMMLVVFYMRTISVENEVGMGQVQLIVEQEVHPNYKALQENVKTTAGGDWKKVYLPFVAKEGYTRLCIRLGYNVQTVEFGGYQILNYGTSVEYDELPSDNVTDSYDKKELFTKDVDWRKEAWDRIEDVRKGEITVIVKDEDGNVIPDADITVDMYDHEFKWGTAVNSKINGATGDKYVEAVSTFFNTAVCENAHKAAVYLNDTTGSARSMVDAAKNLGLKYFRGHTLVWDRPLSKTYNEETGQWISNSSITEELMRLELAGNEEGINEYIQNDLIGKMVGDFKGEICDWDVVNETLTNNELRTTYGISMVKNWYDWAQACDEDAKMYINETSIVGISENGKLEAFKEVLDEMVEAQVDFDGIGIQGHFATLVSPKAFYDQLCELAEYGKEMKITEFDCILDEHVRDEEAEASFVRDIMILAYSMEEMDGFLMWGFWDGSHWAKNAILFDEDWNLKKSGEQFMDLVYNKWWTQETGETGADGTYTVDGYYGDYLITAEADGKTATVDVTCYKGEGNGNTVEIILKESDEESSESTEEGSGSTEESSGSTEEGGESGENDNESSEETYEVIYDLTFDELVTFENTTDFVRGGGYSGSVTLTTEVDHTTGNGQSLKMEGRKSVSHRVKLLNVLEDIEVGESYVITAWVYSDTAVDNVGIGAYSAQGTQYASTAIASSKCDIEAKKWTKIELNYTHTDESITQLGVGQILGSNVAETIYLDDITIARVKEDDESGEEGSESTEGSDESDEESSESTEESSESTEESSESTEESSESTEESSESTEESSESTEESSESTEESSGSAEKGDESGEDDNESSEEADGVIYKRIFDDLDTFVNTVDFVRGGGYSGGVTLTTEVDHTTGSGQSLMMEGRKAAYHRVKLLNVLEDVEVGESYIITAWVYSDTAAENVGIGAYSSSGTYASSPIASSKCNIEAKTWTKIELNYKHTDESITQLGVGQFSTTVLAEKIYLDDITITKVTE